MRMRTEQAMTRWSLALITAFGLGAAGQAAAAPDVEGGESFAEPNGTYTVLKTFEVYSEANPDNPDPVPGNYTYVYTLTNDSSSFVSILGFDLEAPLGSITSAGFIDGAAVEPSATTVGQVAGTDVIEWDFLVDLLDPGETTEQLTVHSPFEPGMTGDNMASVNGDFALDTPGTCVGPAVEPAQDCNLDVTKEACVVEPPAPIGDACQGKAVAFDFEYTGLGCDASSHLQAPWAASCRKGANGEEPVEITVYSKRQRKGWGWWKKKRKRKAIFAHETDVQVGDVITVDANAAGYSTLGQKVRVKIRQGDTKIEFDRFVTNCKEPLGPGNQFGSVKITSLTSTHGGTVTLPDDDPEECSTEIDVAPAPHCVGKVTSLKVRYTAEDCSATITDQASHGWLCFDAAAATSDPVRIIVDASPNPGGGPRLLDVTGVVAGDVLTIDAAAGGLGQLPATTGWWIKNANTGELIQDGYMRTDCVKPLNLGDQIGALQVFGVNSTQGGSNALGNDVEYTYVVTNPNADPATNVSLDDDQLGNIASGLTLAGGESQTFVSTALIEQTTTNIATVTGEVNGQMCNPATAEATITVTAPDDDGQTCTTMASAVLLKYSGPTILGVDVTLVTTNFDNTNDIVPYGTIDLVQDSTLLALPVENGWSVDATAHGELALGTELKVSIDHGNIQHHLDVSCAGGSVLQSNAPAPLVGGGASTDWFVVDFNQTEE
ncbi:MAG: hypothetical protein AAGC67_14010 [Myxococcota bacterium]